MATPILITITERAKEFYAFNSGDEPSELTLWREISCGSAGADYGPVEDFSQIVEPGDTDIIKFPGDGNYTIFANGIMIGPANYQKGLFDSMIVYVSAALCGISGINCLSLTQCTGDTPNYLNNAIAKVILYASMYNPKYQEGIATAYQKIKCSAIEPFNRLLKQEKYLGISNTDEILKVELAHLYYELYNADVNNPMDIASKEEIDELYDYENISYCIAKLGIKTDCDPYVPPGLKHTTSLTVSPTTIGLGVGTDITVSYKFTANDDEFTAIISTNVPGLTSISQFDGVLRTTIDPKVETSKTYFIEYAYNRGGVTSTNTVTASLTAYPPQWYGGESTVQDFESLSTTNKVEVDDIFGAITNVSPVYKANSDGTSSNTNTKDKYLWWITKNPVKFYIGAFEIISGPWAQTCDPNSYAIIHKAVTTVMGTEEVTMHYYRTCPLQDLTGQTLEYTIKQA